MCGLFGYYIVKAPSTEREATLWSSFVAGMRLAALARGKDSWGWAGYDARGRHRVRRGMGSILEGKQAHPPRSIQACVGHTRLATVGKVSLANAHPFRYGSVIGSHNGGIWSGYDRAGYDVDSMALIDAISTGDKLVKHLSGYGAVHWLDVSEGATYVCRMKRGDLDLLHIKIGRMVAYCWVSDAGTLADCVRVLPQVKVRPLEAPKAGRVYRVTPRGFERTKRRIELQNGYSGHDWSAWNGQEPSGGWYSTRSRGKTEYRFVTMLDLWTGKEDGIFDYGWFKQDKDSTYRYWLAEKDGSYHRADGYLGSVSMSEDVEGNILVPMSWKAKDRYWWILDPSGDLMILDTDTDDILDVQTRAVIGTWAGGKVARTG